MSYQLSSVLSPHLIWQTCLQLPLAYWMILPPRKSGSRWASWTYLTVVSPHTHLPHVTMMIMMAATMKMDLRYQNRTLYPIITITVHLGLMEIAITVRPVVAVVTTL
ncbi:hypothetical protein DSECCO2_363160 [anaerobic digester metagenome]